jgi:Amt family ammonium transporter
MAGRGVTGLFYGDSKQLVAQLVETGVGIAWNVCVGGAFFWAIGKVLGSNRVSAAVEIAGLDVPEMGLPGYPEFIKVTPPEEIPAAEVAAAKKAIPALA